MDYIAEAKKDMAAYRAKKGWAKSVLLPGVGNTGGDNVHCGTINSKGVKQANSFPCHNPVRYYTDSMVLWSAFGSRCDDIVTDAYLNWLLYRSPWSQTGVVPKDDYDFIKNQGLVFSGLDTLPANLVHNFLIASRSAVEWPNFIKDWYQLTQEGIDASVAYLMLTVFISKTGTYNSLFTGESPGYLCSIDKYDWPLDMARATEKYSLNFITGNATGRSTKMFYPTAETRPVNTLWGELTTTDNQDSYVSILGNIYGSMSEKSEERSVFMPSGSHVVKNIKIFTQDNIKEIIRSEQDRLYGMCQCLAA